MHLGHARTHLVAWLRARQASGRVVMRIEDLDLARTRPGSEHELLRDHEWLGLDWDEGPVRQSERLELYEQALAQLQRDGVVYLCSCTRRELQASSAPHEDGPIYPGTCRSGPLHPERPLALRFVMPEPSPGFTDAYAGEVEAGRVHGDFILRRSDGVFAYQLAVVVDDADQKITEVVRGDDLLLSTPRQLALYDALGLRRPSFAHVPLVLGATGARLAKRDAGTSLADYRAAGVTREALLGQLAVSLGLVPDAKPLSLDELLTRDLAHISSQFWTLPEASAP